MPGRVRALAQNEIDVKIDIARKLYDYIISKKVSIPWIAKQVGITAHSVHSAMRYGDPHRTVHLNRQLAIASLLGIQIPHYNLRDFRLSSLKVMDEFYNSQGAGELFTIKLTARNVGNVSEKYTTASHNYRIQRKPAIIKRFTRSIANGFLKIATAIEKVAV